MRAKTSVKRTSTLKIFHDKTMPVLNARNQNKYPKKALNDIPQQIRLVFALYPLLLDFTLNRTSCIPFLLCKLHIRRYHITINIMPNWVGSSHRKYDHLSRHELTLLLSGSLELYTYSPKVSPYSFINFLYL